MPRISALRRIALFASLSLASVLPAAADEPAAWDQARVTSIAKQLADDCDAFEQEVRKQPGLGQVGAVSAGPGFGLQQQSRTLREQSRVLEGHLRKGANEAETRNEFRTLREIADDVEQSAQRSPLDGPLMAAWAKVADGMRQLAPYYGTRASAP